METPAETLLREICLWCPGEELRPLLVRAIEILGPRVVVDLPWEPAAARDHLQERLSAFIDGEEA